MESVMREVWKLLKPGGSLVFWEHVTNEDAVTAVAQGKIRIGCFTKGSGLI